MVWMYSSCVESRLSWMVVLDPLGIPIMSLTNVLQLDIDDLSETIASLNNTDVIIVLDTPIGRRALGVLLPMMLMIMSK